VRIATRLTLISGCIALTLIGLLPALAWSFLAFREAKAGYLLTHRIKDTFLERTSLRDQYSLFREERMQAMWEANRTAFDQLLAEAEARFHRPEEREQVRRLRQHLETGDALFRRIVGNTAKLKAAGGALPVYEDLDKRLSSQLLLKSAAIQEAVTALDDSNERWVEQTYRRLGILVGVTAVALALVTILALTQIARLINRRLAPLHAGVKQIAGGNLGFRLGLDGADEFSDLSRAIDAMAGRLESVAGRLGAEIAQRVALEARRESDARFRAWFDLPIFGISISSPAKLWLEVNDHLCAMLGYGREELAGMTWAELTHPEDLAEDLRQFERVLAGEIDGYSMEKRFLCRGGDILETEMAVRCVRKPGGGVAYFVKLVQDITERKRAQAELRQAEAERQALAERLGQVQRLEALGVLVAGVAHNLNNALTAAMTTASVHERTCAEPGDREAFGIIGTACRRGRDVVKSLTQFARPTLAHSAPVDLHALLGEVTTLLESTTGGRIRTVTAFAAEAPWIHGDAGSLSHAVMNLCLNSLDAMPAGGTLTLRTVLAAGDRVELSIEDDGEGMTPEVLARVREPFFTTKEVGKGTGLGVSMAHGVVKVHGGTMEIASTPGRCTTVKLGFPRIPVPSPAQPAPEPPAPGRGAAAGLEVLLVDDDDDVRFLVARMLKRAGHQLRTAAGGEQALAGLAAEGLPDLVILDQNMPGMDGIQTMERIRVLYPDLPILISSGQPDIEDWDCFRRPNVAVLPKPFEVSEIMASLGRIRPR